MVDVVSVTMQRARVVSVAVIVLALATFAVWFIHGRGGSFAQGPLKVKAGNTELVFPAPQDSSAWSAMAGGFLLCAPAQQVTVTKVTALHARGAQQFEAFTRSFTIRRLGDGRVSEPVIGGYGAPPWIGGKEHPHQDRLVGDLRNAEGVQITPPRCEDSTSAPGESAVELLLAVSTGNEGAVFDGVILDYDSDGHHYQTRVDVAVTLCGTKTHDRDCTPGSL